MHAPDLSYYTPTCIDETGTFENRYDNGKTLRFETPRARFITPMPGEPVSAAIEWLWNDRIPRGRVTVIEGPAGAGKTFLTASLTATVTRGAPWGDGPAPGQREGDGHNFPGDHTGHPVSSSDNHTDSAGKMSQSPAGEVLYYCCERESEDVVAPRVVRNGADVMRIIFRSDVDIQDSVKGPMGTRMMEFPHDLAMLEYDLKGNSGVRLVVIDPLRDFCATPRLMRKALGILDALAAKYKVAIVVTIQADVKFTEEGQIRQVPRPWDEAARYVWCVTRDPCDPELRRFEPKRTTFCKEPTGVAFRVAESGALTWEPLPVRQTKFEKCKSWLDERLGQGSAWADEVQCDARAMGFSEGMVHRAREDLNILTDRKGGIAGNGRWSWRRAGQPFEPPKGLSMKDKVEAQYENLRRSKEMGEEFFGALTQVLMGDIDAGPRSRRKSGGRRSRDVTPCSDSAAETSTRICDAHSPFTGASLRSSPGHPSQGEQDEAVPSQQPKGCTPAGIPLGDRSEAELRDVRSQAELGTENLPAEKFPNLKS